MIPQTFIFSVFSVNDSEALIDSVDLLYSRRWALLMRGRDVCKTDGG